MAGVVTALELQRKRKDRVNVYVNDVYAFSLNVIVAERAGLRTGLFLKDEDVQKLAGDDSYQRAFDTALNFLSYRPRSEREVRLNLIKKRVDPSLIETVVSRLGELRLLDDKAFAQFWQENRQRCSPRGPRAIKMELRGKGVEDAVIEEVLGAAGDQESDAYAAAQKKVRSLRGLDYATFRQRLSGHLLRRGFNYDVVSSVVKRVWRELGEAEPDDDQARD